MDQNHGSHWDWKSGKTWKDGKAFSSQGKVREFCQDWKSQGILLKILEKSEKFILGNWKKYWKSQGNLSASNSENLANVVRYFK